MLPLYPHTLSANNLDVSPSSFAQIEKERSIRRRRFRWRRYYVEPHVLIIAIPTAVHESLHITLYMEYQSQLCRIGIQNTWATKGASTFQASHPEGDSAEGDSSGGPRPQRKGNNWPTLVIEAGDSESLNQLRMDMRWWFAVSDHKVKIVILAKLDRRQPKIILEKWEEEAATRLGATTTRRAAALQPVLKQEIMISHDETTSPISYNVTKGPLVLEFRLLYLREPGPQESDFIISISDLQRYAEAVWDKV